MYQYWNVKSILVCQDTRSFRVGKSKKYPAMRYSDFRPYVMQKRWWESR